MKCSSEELDQLFEAVANDHRRAIIYELSLQPRSISQLAESRRLSLPAIHKHIKVLELANLIQRKKSGRVNFLALNKATLQLLQGWLYQYHSYWGNQDESLDNYVVRIEAAEQLQVTKYKEK